jgi:hypothetical protein
MTIGLTAHSVRAGVVIDVAGVPMSVWAADEARAEAVAAALRSAIPVDLPARVSLRFEDTPAPLVAWAGTKPLEVRRVEPELAFVRGDGGLVGCVTPNGITVSGDAPQRAVAFTRVLFMAVGHLLRWHDRQVVHAAAIARDDCCVLAFGESGAGKSTLALCALRGGWSVLADDLVAVRLVDDEVVADGIPRPITAPAELVDDPRVGRAPGVRRDRRELPPDALTPGTHAVHAVVLTRHADSRHGTLRDLGARDALRLVVSSSFAVDDPDALRRVFPVASRLARLPAVELALGQLVTGRVDDGARLLDQLRRRL